MIGTKIAHYEITDKLGEGGMGVVYRAHDTKLNRDVAIKVLPNTLTHDRDRMDRFRREAQLLAQLNHSAIAGIHGMEESDGQYALVMELAEGPTLGDRLSTGPIPVKEALAIAKQIAEALEAAHEKGIIHRDLKPPNIKISDDGEVKVLDFGLAKALEGDPTSSTDPSHSPTLTMAATQAGVIMGTAAYMSPEQARGKTADKRADIWGFGVVLYEMLTGRQMFGGETVSDSLAGVLKTEIDLKALPDETPRQIRKLLSRCLERDRKQRLRDIGDARIEIEEALSGSDEQISATAETPAVKLVWRAAGLAAAVALVAGVAVGWLAWKGDQSPEIPYRRFAIATASNLGYGTISPDGKHVVYTLVNQGQSIHLWLRDLESDASREIGELPWRRNSGAWSPESDAFVFIVGNELMKFSLTNGATVRLCTLESSGTRGTAWSPDGEVIVTSLGSLGSSSLFEVPARGGPQRPLTEPDTTEQRAAQRAPHFLPSQDGRRVLLYVESTGPEDSRIMLWNMAGEERKELVRGNWPVYSPTGHILYQTDGGLWALPFSAESLTVTGDPFLVRQSAVAPSVAHDGTLVYLEIAGASQQQLVWKSREGRTLGTIGQPQERIWGPTISPDGKRVAVHAIDNGNQDVWIHETVRSVKTRLTSDPADENRAIWSPDGRYLIYSSDRNGQYDVFMRAADGSGEERALFGMPGDEWVMDWSSDGRYFAVDSLAGGMSGGQPLKLFSVEDPLAGKASDPAPLLGTEFREHSPSFSPNGKWLAYTSNETGRDEVFVQRFPELGGKVQISIDGGSRPRWRADGKEICFIRDSSVLAVSVSMAPEFTVGEPEVLFQHETLEQDGGQQYDVSDDGQRFVVVDSVDQEQESTIRLVQNWSAEFRDSQ